MSEHGSADAALDALPGVARDAGVEDYTICPLGVVESEMRAAHAVGARLLSCRHAEYPEFLKQISDAPPLLWCIGDTGILKRPMIGLVGARNASSLGTRMAKSLAADLASRGFVITSGLARGVDTAAHLASLEGGTVAVMAGGVDVIYPAENTRLAQQIAETGVRVSEPPIGLTPQARHFPSRNRLISGMAQAVVVVEAAAKSGSLITARNALEQGREVMAVPGHPFDARASGCNMLIRDGAHLVRNAADIIDALPGAEATSVQPDLPLDVPQKAPPARSLRETAALHDQILRRLGPSPLAARRGSAHSRSLGPGPICGAGATGPGT